MAKLSSDGKYVTVEKGDTLSEIAEKYAGGVSKTNQLKTINKIPNADLIYVGQKIYLTGTGTSSSSSNTSSNKATITHLGLQANSENVIFATWEWTRSNTKEFQIIWKYATGDGVGFIGSETNVDFEKGTQDIYHATWSGYPENATKVMFWVKPISTTKKQGDKEVNHWTASWTNKEYKLSANPPTKAPTPTVKLEGYKLTASVDNIDINATSVEFQVVQDNKKVIATKSGAVKTGHAEYTFTVPAGGEYKVRCRGVKNGEYGEWSEYSGNESSAPAAPAEIITIKALSETSVQLDWTNVSNADSYEIQYTTKKMYFDSSTEVKTATVDASAAGHAEITGLDSGEEYFFRVRAVKGDDKSGWTAIKSIIIGEKPSPPTTWSSTTTAIVGEDITLYWMHNAKDGSSQTYANLEVYINNVKQNIPLIENSTDKNEKDKTSSYTIQTSSLSEGAVIKWRVKTRGITMDYSDWSVERTIDVYAPPTVDLEVTDASGADLCPAEITYLHIETVNPGQTGHRVYYDTNIFSHELDVEYMLTFKARSSVEDTMLISCVGGDENNNKNEYALSTNWRTYRFKYTTIAGGSITLWLKDANTDVDIIDIQIVKTADNVRLLASDACSTITYWSPQGSHTITVKTENKSTGDTIGTLTSFPFYIKALAGPSTQMPIGYHVNIMSNEIYETVDAVGNPKYVNVGESVYSKFYDVSGQLLLELSAGSIDLQNGITYTLVCTASMDSGLTGESSIEFTVSWVDESFLPNAEIGIDTDTYSASIRPYCETHTRTYYKVELVDGIYTKTNETLGYVYGEAVEGAMTTTGESVLTGVCAEGDDVYYCIVDNSQLVDDVTLSVYRREFDGSFVEIATNLNNTDATFVTDPHPALDYARYRIVATTKTTGAVSYHDIPNYPVGGIAVIIQWDEEWSNFAATDSEDALDQPPWSGSMLKLPYNIDVSDKNAIDVSLVEYIGRKRPVSYYGTQLGESATWTTEIPAYDKETLYALRRLAIYTGDVYVREPSGSGYWANISVSFSQKHLGVTIPVTLELTRVEGGM